MQFGIKQLSNTIMEISKDVISQTFYEIRPSYYVPHIVGDSAWADSIMFSQVYATGGDFKTGIIDTGASYVSLDDTDTDSSSIISIVKTWAKQTNWTIIQYTQSITRRQLDLIEEKLIALKKNWDLGIQKSCFLGLKGNKHFPGLLNYPGIKKDTTSISKALSDNTTTFDKLKEIIQKMITEYMKNCSHTVFPNRLIVPSTDYYGLTLPATESNVLLTINDLIENTFKALKRSSDFEVLPLAYACSDELKKYLGSSQTKDRYVLYRCDRDCLRRDIPVDLTTCPAGTSDNFNLVQVMYGQFSQVTVRRPETMMYFEGAE